MPGGGGSGNPSAGLTSDLSLREAWGGIWETALPPRSLKEFFVERVVLTPMGIPVRARPEYWPAPLCVGNFRPAVVSTKIVGSWNSW